MIVVVPFDHVQHDIVERGEFSYFNILVEWGKVSTSNRAKRRLSLTGSALLNSDNDGLSLG